MKCPNCRNDIYEVRAESSIAGMSIVLDQCRVCGGIWADRFEVYQLPLAVAQKIDALDLSAVVHDVVVADELWCPRDHSRLNRFFDPMIPKDLQLDTCAKCGGIWMNRGELAHYKEDIKKKNDERKIVTTDKKAEQLMEALFAGQKTNYATLGRIGKFLMRPVSHAAVASPFGFYSPLFTDQQPKDPFALAPEELAQIRSAPQEQKAQLWESFVMQKKGVAQEEKKKVFVGQVVMVLLEIALRLFFR